MFTPLSSVFIDLQAAWLMKVRALTEQTYVDELEVEDEGIAEMLLDENAIADVARKRREGWIAHSTYV